MLREYSETNTLKHRTERAEMMLRGIEWVRERKEKNGEQKQSQSEREREKG